MKTYRVTLNPDKHSGSIRVEFVSADRYEISGGILYLYRREKHPNGGVSNDVVKLFAPGYWLAVEPVQEDSDD
jgi:hypothetical protein